MRKLYALVPVIALALAAGCADQSATAPLSPDEVAAKQHGDHGPNGAAERVTGEIWWMGGGAMRSAEFVAHEEAPGKAPHQGNMYYAMYDEEGEVTSWFRMKVCGAAIEGDRAWFGGEIVEAGGIYEVGELIRAWAIDGGTPGWDGDEFGAERPAALDCDDIDMSMPWTFEVIEGNLVVHQ